MLHSLVYQEHTWTLLKNLCNKRSPRENNFTSCIVFPALRTLRNIHLLWCAAAMRSLTSPFLRKGCEGSIRAPPPLSHIYRVSGGEFTAQKWHLCVRGRGEFINVSDIYCRFTFPKRNTYFCSHGDGWETRFSVEPLHPQNLIWI